MSFSNICGASNVHLWNTTNQKFLTHLLNSAFTIKSKNKMKYSVTTQSIITLVLKKGATICKTPISFHYNHLKCKNKG